MPPLATKVFLTYSKDRYKTPQTIGVKTANATKLVHLLYVQVTRVFRQQLAEP
jgi:hypothetical protein